MLTQEYIDAIRKLEKGFMQPATYHGAVAIDSEDGPMPSEDWLMVHDPVDDASRIEDEVIGWLSRLSAPGYLDCTDWLGPFETMDDALVALVDMWGDEYPGAALSAPLATTGDVYDALP